MEKRPSTKLYLLILIVLLVSVASFNLARLSSEKVSPATGLAVQQPKPCDAWCGPAMECCTNRDLGDLPQPNGEYADGPAQCQSRCIANANCKAWTWVVPEDPVCPGCCWLKVDPLPGPSANDCCISGIKTSSGTCPQNGCGYPCSIVCGTSCYGVAECPAGWQCTTDGPVCPSGTTTTTSTTTTTEPTTTTITPGSGTEDCPYDACSSSESGSWKCYSSSHAQKCQQEDKNGDGTSAYCWSGPVACSPGQTCSNSVCSGSGGGAATYAATPNSAGCPNGKQPITFTWIPATAPGVQAQWLDIDPTGNFAGCSPGGNPCKGYDVTGLSSYMVPDTITLPNYWRINTLHSDGTWVPSGKYWFNPVACGGGGSGGDIPKGAKTCSGFCGKWNPAGCWCDSVCKEYNDCCPDYASACPGGGGTSRPRPGGGTPANKFTIVFVPLNFQQSEYSTFRSSAQNTFDYFKRISPFSRCPNPNDRIQAFFAEISDCPSSGICTGTTVGDCGRCANLATDCARNYLNRVGVSGPFKAAGISKTTWVVNGCGWQLVPCGEQYEGIGSATFYQIPSLVSHEISHTITLCHECTQVNGKPRDSWEDCPNPDINDYSGYVMCPITFDKFSQGSYNYLLGASGCTNGLRSSASRYLQGC